jgi:hypothetical protein
MSELSTDYQSTEKTTRHKLTIQVLGLPSTTKRTLLMSQNLFYIRINIVIASSTKALTNAITGAYEAVGTGVKFPVSDKST